MICRRASAPASTNSPSHIGWRTLRDALQLFWSSADASAKRWFLFALSLVGAAALLGALAPIGLQLAIDALAADAVSRPAAAPIGLVLFYVLGQYLNRSLNELRMFAFGRGEQRVRRRIGSRLFGHLVRLPMKFHLDRKTGAIGETVEQGLRGHQLLLTHLVYTVLPAGLELLTVGVVLSHYGHQSYLAIFAAASAGYVLAFQRGAADIQEPARAVSDAHIEAHAVLTDSLLNYETVKYFDAESVVCTRYQAALSRTESAWVRFYRRRVGNGLLVAAIFAASLGTALICAAHDVMRGAMTIGAFVLVNTYVMRLVQPLELLGVAVRDIAQALGFMDRLLKLLLERPEGEVAGAPPPASQERVETRRADTHRSDDKRFSRASRRGELVFENVSFSYRAGRPVLRDVSFRAPAGCTVAIVGASGSGKSSLIRLLFRLYQPDSGRIVLDGEPIERLPLSVLRQAIAVVPQDTVLFHDSIAKNIGFGRAGSSRAEIEEAARLAHLHEFILGLPEGYETVVGERGLKLSGGERQRVAIARASLRRPSVFVFDEATSSLDSRTEREILRNLAEVSKGSTSLVIAHRLSTVVGADEILVLEAGVVTERGSHSNLIACGGRYAALWSTQNEGSHQGRAVEL